jgi:hypothetical protein
VPAKKGRRLVIDASVAMSAGRRTAADPVSKDCRSFLEKMRQETRHHVVLPPPLRKEWDKHMSPFASTWLVAMAARGRVISEDIGSNTTRQREIESAAATKLTQVKALRKDFHLIETALATDRIVVSRDETVRRLFKAAAPRVVAIQKVVWVNPAAPAENAIEWLLKGAPSEGTRMLGYVEK